MGKRLAFLYIYYAKGVRGLMLLVIRERVVVEKRIAPNIEATTGELHIFHHFILPRSGVFRQAIQVGWNIPVVATRGNPDLLMLIYTKHLHVDGNWN